MNFIKTKPETGRNLSFIKTFEALIERFDKNPINIVETGTIRGESETSRFGDGWSTLNWKYYTENTNSKVWIVDIDQNSINIAKKIAPETENFKYINSDAIDFLNSFTEKIDLLFLDSVDYCGDEENIRKCWEYTLNEVKAALPHLHEKSFILIDDTFNIAWDGKGKTAVPFLLENGWEVVHCVDSQVLLKRSEKRNTNPKVSCVMTTYGRYTCVQNSIAMFLRQDYVGEKELIIYNTASNHPYELGESLQKYSNIIKVINNNTDKITGKDYTNVGAIRRDAIDYITGELYICWDDDDIFLPYNITQCVEGLLKSGKRAWKPEFSFYWGAKPEPEFAENVMEASVIVYAEELKKRGFKLETGSEHCGWYQELVDEGKFCTDKTAIPGYCFNWSRSTGPSDHKQSGDINNKNNFENHKKQSTDFGNKLEEVEYKITDNFFEPFYKVLRKEIKKAPKDSLKLNSFNRFTPKELVFISAQPDDKYFVWQIEVQIHNFKKYGFSDKMRVLVFHVNEKYNPEWDKLVKAYPEVKFFFYKNTGAQYTNYIPVLRPHILSKHFKEYPELKDNAVFYHDSDIIFSSHLDFTPLCCGDTWYLSDTVSYIGSRYIKSKGEYIFEEMCKIVGVDKTLVEENEQNSGGAQYLAKNLTAEYWAKVEKDCISLYDYMKKVNNEDLFKRNPKTDIQQWCADMWAVLFNSLLFGNKIKVHPILNFSWATSMMEEFNRCKIFHNAGATGDRKDLFFKGRYLDKYPYNEDFSNFSTSFASHIYADLIKEVAKVSCLL